jgi:Holliday junction resolvase
MEKKRINSKRKGNAAELELAKILTKRFDLPFARVGVSSGARVKNTKLPDNAVNVMSGDMIIPDGFRFGTIEVKSRKHAINYRVENKALEDIIEQAENDAVLTGKPPLICIKANRHGWDVMIPVDVFDHGARLGDYFVRYARYLIYRLDVLLDATNDKFWFNNTEAAQ